MARRSMAGQLNMFDFWNNLTPAEDGAEVQMVSLMPDENEPAAQENEAEPEQSVKEEAALPGEKEEEAPQEDEAEAVMRKALFYPDGTIRAEVAYLNYQKVRVVREGKEPVIREFETSKEAVDYYIDEMLKLQGEETV